MHEAPGKDDLKHSTSFTNILTGETNGNLQKNNEKINLFGGSFS